LLAKIRRSPVDLHVAAENFLMRLFSDPQPAIEWFCTGGSVCIGIEGVDERPDFDVKRDARVRAAGQPKLPVRFQVRVGEA
jgi:hypothetical protein